MKCTPDSCPLHPKHLNSEYHSLIVKRIFIDLDVGFDT